ncbi:TPA: hypothetical protein I7122_21475 [Vibrio vulnificus]|nr:hypothetical protein [Vibrio vulnificus]
MTTFRTTFEFQIDVNFVDREKAEQFFLESDWKEYFFDFNDLDDAAEHLARNFHMSDARYEEGKEWKHIEGFGSYYFDRHANVWRLTKDLLKNGDELPCGDVIIKYEMETDCTDITEFEH